MNLFRAFMELDEINEGISRQELITRFNKATGKNYNLNSLSKFPDKKLFAMVRDAEAKNARELAKQKAALSNKQEFDLDFEPSETSETCDFCNTRLTDFGECPKCDLDEEGLDEGTHSNKPAVLTEFVSSSGKQVKLSNLTASPTANSSQSHSSFKTTTGKYKVAIVSDKGRLRAMGDDGEHGLAFVAFPNNLREYEGQHYEVDQLIWNGKNYRVSGNIEEV